MVLEQESRSVKLTTPLGPDKLLLVSFSGDEHVSRLFRYELEMISDDNAIGPADIVGKNVTFSVQMTDGSPRLFNGFVSRFFAGDEEHGRRNYRAEVVPWLWFLTRTSDCRIFQNKTVVQIIEQIFGDLGFSDYEIDQVKGDHPQREYCAQYRQTAFEFISWLMEEEGIFYFFKHEDGKHTLVMADQKGAYADCVEKEVDYPSDTSAVAVEDHITRWEHRYEFRTGKWAQTDYNFKTPSTSLMTNESTVVELPGNDKYEFYDYPGDYPDTGVGGGLTRVRMEEEEVEHDVVDGASKCKSFTPGGKFKIRQHRCESEAGKSFVITSIRHSATEPAGYETGAAVEADYSNVFTCVPDSVTFRPARITPRPVVHGLQTAVVVGPAGEDIFPDEFGRVKVQFFWDREGKKDENSSCWIRVSQNWGGRGWGGTFIPHVGQEVIVIFEEGDPDRPVIVGRLYNAEQTIPLNLPDEKTKSMISDHGGNKMVWEGADGSQQMHFFSPTENTVFSIGEGCIHQETDGNHVLRIGSDRDDQVDGNEAIKVQGSREDTVNVNVNTTVGGNVDTRITGAKKEKVDGNSDFFKAGTEAKMNLSAKTETTVGVQHSTFVGAKVEANMSAALTATKGLKYTVTDAVEKKKSAMKEEEVTAAYSLKSGAVVSIEGVAGTMIEGGKAMVDLETGKIVIKNAGGSKITLDGGTITFDCSSVVFKCDTINFKGAYLNKGKQGSLFM